MNRNERYVNNLWTEVRTNRHLMWTFTKQCAPNSSSRHTSVEAMFTLLISNFFACPHSWSMAPDFFCCHLLFLCLFSHPPQLQIKTRARILMDSRLFDSLSNLCLTSVDTKSQIISAYCAYSLMCSIRSIQKALWRWPPVTIQTRMHTIEMFM